jgi:hypothetical protein
VEVTRIGLRLWEADAVVLYDWLMSVDMNTVPITHPAQKQALMDLLVCLETQAPVEGVTEDQIAEAQAVVAKDMGW